jgi:hypothetical protein
MRKEKRRFSKIISDYFLLEDDLPVMIATKHPRQSKINEERRGQRALPDGENHC